MWGNTLDVTHRRTPARSGANSKAFKFVKLMQNEQKFVSTIISTYGHSHDTNFQNNPGKSFKKKVGVTQKSFTLDDWVGKKGVKKNLW